MDPPGIIPRINQREKSKRDKTYLFLQDLLFLPGKAAATDLQQTERPLASDTVLVKLQESRAIEESPLRTSARRILSSAAVHRFSHRVLLRKTSSKDCVDSTGVFIETTRVEEAGWGLKEGRVV